MPWVFFALVLALSLPFWLAGALTSVEDLPINLPVSALMAVAPALAAMILAGREGGSAAVRHLLARILDVNRTGNPLWIALALLTMPVLVTAAYGLLLITGTPLPDTVLPWEALPVFLVLFFVAAAFEELGWQAWAADRMLKTMTPLRTATLLGLVWAAWHVLPYAQAGNTAAWIAWQCATTIMLRILIMWLYVNAGASLFVAILFHMMINVTAFMFPNYGSHYDPFAAFIVTGLAVALIVWRKGAALR